MFCLTRHILPTNLQIIARNAAHIQASFNSRYKNSELFHIPVLIKNNFFHTWKCTVKSKFLTLVIILNNFTENVNFI